MVRQRGVVVQCYPRRRKQELVRECKAFFQPVADLRPAEAHLTLELQGARQPTRPPPADQPGPADSDQQDDPDAGGVDDLHQECQRSDHREDSCVQPDRGFHSSIICLKSREGSFANNCYERTLHRFFGKDENHQAITFARLDIGYLPKRLGR